MPRIDDSFLECSIYLYPAQTSAESGERVGGSGLMVAIQSKVFDYKWYVYAVTNSHVIREGKATFIRINTPGGKFEIVPTTQNNWFHHPNGDDIAACPIGLPLDKFKYRFVPRSDFLSQERITQHKIGPGADVFMVGRFIGHDGRHRNTPSLRFGNIAMMPLEPLHHQRGHMQESFLVEARSLPGYSGSPVFVHAPAVGEHKPDGTLEFICFGPWLLGLDWCHLHTKEPVREKGTDDPEIGEGWFVYSNSGMAGVIPIWKLDELLDIDELRESRNRTEQQLMEEKARINTNPDITPLSSPTPDIQTQAPAPEGQPQRA